MSSLMTMASQVQFEVQLLCTVLVSTLIRAVSIFPRSRRDAMSSPIQRKSIRDSIVRYLYGWLSPAPPSFAAEFGGVAPRGY